MPMANNSQAMVLNRAALCHYSHLRNRLRPLSLKKIMSTDHIARVRVCYPNNL